MIRPFTAVCVLLAAGSGLYLYTEKHRTTMLDQQISQIVQSTQHIRERTSMLRAEWALLNQPDRLQSLAGRFLPELHPMAPAQFVQMAALAQHLPEIAPPAPAPTVALVLAPQQVIARSLTRELPADERRADPVAGMRAADADQPKPQHVRALPHPVQLASAAVMIRRPATRVPPPVRPASLGSTGPVSPGTVLTRAMAPRGMSASRMASYDGGAVRSLLSSTGAYAHPTPVAAAWRLPRRLATSSPAAGDAFGGVRSSLGFSHVALSAPVPVQDGE